MQILIYGATDIAYVIASHLYQEHDITLIDESGRAPEKFNSLDLGYVSGSAADINVLEQAKGGGVSLFIACSLHDEANIVACWTIKKIIEVETVCFVHKMAIYENLVSQNQNRYQTKYDIDTVIWPEQLLTEEIFRIIMVPEAVDVKYFSGGAAKLFEYRIRPGSVLSRVRIMDYLFPKNVLIVGITREGRLFIPSGSTVIEPDDKVIFMGSGPALDLLAASICKAGEITNTAAVIGGGSVGFMLAQQLERAGIRVKLFEHSEERCNFLAENLKKTLVLQGDGTDIELLESEAVGGMDVVVCVTNNDEKNLLCSLLVKQLGASRIITRAGNVRNAQLFDRVGIDVIVSPREAAMKELLNRIHSRDVNVLALVEGGQGEVLLVTVRGTFLETRVCDLQLPVGSIIGIITRGRRIIIPDGNTVIQAGDQLKIFSVAENAQALKEIFAV